MGANRDVFLFLDLESTGLDPVNDDLWEVAAILVDKDLNELDRMQSIVQYDDLGGQYPFTTYLEDFERKNHYVWEMHTESGLLEAYKNEPFPLPKSGIDWVLCEMIEPYEDEIVLAGSSVHYDHAFIDNHLPQLAKRLFHGHIDMSSIRNFINTIKPNVSDKFRKDTGTKHRAMDDIERDLTWARNFREFLQPVLLSM